jgi:hypothetical protein
MIRFTHNSFPCTVLLGVSSRAFLHALLRPTSSFPRPSRMQRPKSRRRSRPTLARSEPRLSPVSPARCATATRPPCFLVARSCGSPSGGCSQRARSPRRIAGWVATNCSRPTIASLAPSDRANGAARSEHESGRSGRLGRTVQGTGTSSRSSRFQTGPHTCTSTRSWVTTTLRTSSSARRMGRGACSLSCRAIRETAHP